GRSAPPARVHLRMGVSRRRDPARIDHRRHRPHQPARRLDGGPPRPPRARRRGRRRPPGRLAPLPRPPPPHRRGRARAPRPLARPPAPPPPGPPPPGPPPPPADRAGGSFDRLAESLLAQPDVSRSTMMGLPCLRRSGAFFASYDRRTGNLVVKLP